MKKQGLMVLSYLVLFPLQVMALTCSKDVPNCVYYGYKYASCPGGYMACPFDTSFRQCDREAFNNDFKFSLNNGGTGWSKANTSSASKNYSGAFIVGASSSTIRCSSTVNASKTPVMQSHTHVASSVFGASAFVLSRKNASNARYSGFCGVMTYSKVVTSTSAGSAETRPVNQAVDGYFYNYTDSIKTTLQKSLPSTKPSCATMGYVDKVADCPGGYVKCPFDTTAVMCDMEAKAGEIKYSLKSSDHNGWLRCDGRSLSSISNGKYANSELKTILSSNGFGGNLPNYSGMFLRMKGVYSSYGSTSTYWAMQIDDLAPHSHSVQVVESQPTSSCNQNNGSKNSYTPVTSTALSSSGSQETAYAGTETRPPNYSAYIYIYSGKL